MSNAFFFWIGLSLVYWGVILTGIIGERVGQMPPPKPASPCEHDYNGVIWKEQIHGGRTARKDEYPICPFCKPALEKPVSSCPTMSEWIERGNKPTYYPKGKAETQDVCDKCQEFQARCVCPVKEIQSAGENIHHLAESDYIDNCQNPSREHRELRYFLVNRISEAIKAERAKAANEYKARNAQADAQAHKIAALEQKLAQESIGYDRALERIAELDNKLAAKQEALDKFGRHQPSCQNYVNRELCDCGFNKEKSNG